MTAPGQAEAPAYAGLFSLQGRAALVTGASSGIGLQLAGSFAQAGATVVLAARRLERLAQAVTALRERGFTAHAVQLDVTDGTSIERCWAQAVAHAGQPVDLLLNNAGVLHMERFVDQSPDTIDRVFDTNFRGAMLMAQQAARAMSALGGGSIINVASSSGLRAAAQMASYGASKAALLQLTKIMALELAGKGVRVNALCPGNITTDMHQAFEDRGFDENLRKRIPMRRFGHPSELEGAALLLASAAGSYITGVALPVDGGQVLAWM